MKNNIKKLIDKIILCLLMLSVGTGFCHAEPMQAGSAVIPFKTVLIKFGITMGSVLVALLIIWLVLYNVKKYTRETIKEYNQKALYGDNFKTHKSIDEAIVSFIERNRL